jgi:hypothetical protein
MVSAVAVSYHPFLGMLNMITNNYGSPRSCVPRTLAGISTADCQQEAPKHLGTFAWRKRGVGKYRVVTKQAFKDSSKERPTGPRTRGDSARTKSCGFCYLGLAELCTELKCQVRVSPLQMSCLQLNRTVGSRSLYISVCSHIFIRTQALQVLSVIRLTTSIHALAVISWGSGS